MPFESERFDALYSRADDFLGADRFIDAAVLIRHALKATGGTQEDRLLLKIGLGRCLKHTGQYTEAIAQFGEVYSEVKDSKHHELAYRSLVEQIDTLRVLQMAQDTETHTNLSRRKKLIEKGLCWLRDIGRERWRHMLLLDLSQVLSSLGETEKALDVAEEAYRLRKMYEEYPGWVLSDHVRQVARLARILGSYERSLQVLDEMEESEMSPLERVRVFYERILVLRAMKPPMLVEAIDAARRAARLVDEIQKPRTRLFAYEELADIAIVVQSFDEARDSLHVVREVALGDETIDRAYLLRRARYNFQRAQNALLGDDDGAARKLYQMLTEWISEIEDALAALEE